MIPNIVQAKITGRTGKIELELEGSVTDLERDIKWVEKKSIQVNLISVNTPAYLF